VRGQPDGFSGYPNKTFNSRTSIPDYTVGSPSNYFSTVNSTLRIAASSNGTDNGADIFYYNFNGRTGKFFLDEQAKATLTKYEDFKVQMLNPTAQSDDYFVITDEKGIKYEFSAIEQTANWTGSPFGYISARQVERLSLNIQKEA
jgi:hypothetical protein